MLCFRSEAEVVAWCERRRIERGAVLTQTLIWRLALAWYRGRADPDWRGRGPAEANEILRSVELDGEFWSL